MQTIYSGNLATVNINGNKLKVNRWEVTRDSFSKWCSGKLDFHCPSEEFDPVINAIHAQMFGYLPDEFRDYNYLKPLFW